MDLKLESADLEILNGELSFVTGAAAVVQDLKTRLRTWLGESVFDQTAGVPYTQVIFSRSPNLPAIRAILEQIAIQTTGIQSISLSVEVVGRELRVTGTGKALDQEFDFSQEISA